MVAREVEIQARVKQIGNMNFSSLLII